MRLTHPSQLDALPEGAVLVDGAGCAIKYTDGWRGAPIGWLYERSALYVFGDLVSAGDLVGADPLYLIEATATTAADLDRLLPGAVVLGRRGSSWQRIGDDWVNHVYNWMTGPAISSSYGPMTILHPGDPTEGWGQ